MATGITESVIEEIKVRTDLVELISSYGIQVRTAGASAKACCPFHKEKTPSFNINASKGYYHCFGCGESGDAIKFVEKMEGLTFVEAAKKLADACGVKIEAREDPEAGRRKRLYALMAELAQFYRRCLLKLKEAARAREYLVERDLGEEAQERFLIGYAPAGAAVIYKWAEKYGYTVEELDAAGVVKPPNRPGDAGYHRFGGRLVFTIRDRQGRVVAFSGRQLVEDKRSGKYLNSPETPIFRKSSVLFGFDLAAAEIAKAPHREAIVCEGQIDTIRLHLCGFPVAVASQGTAFTAEHVKMLRRVADAVVLVFDDDGAGHKATVRTAALFLAEEVPVRVARLPDGDDPDSFLRTKGAAAFRALLDAAESIVSFQCRVERAKEANPGSIDAVARVSRAVLATVAACPNAILRASLADEAARLLGIPSAALGEELAKLRAAGTRPVASAANRPAESEPEGAAEEDGEPFGEPFDDPVEDAGEPISGEDAHAAAPPSDTEFALMEFLFANEYDATLDGMVGEFLPPETFGHAFTRAFVDTWRAGVSSGQHGFSDFAAALPPTERRWYGLVVTGSDRPQACAMSATDQLQEFIRSLWCERLRKLRGELPASGDAEADAERLRISMDLKRFRLVRWATVKEMIRDRTKGEH